MQVLAFLSKHRGVGTSTLACHVAVQAQLTGHGPVTLTGLRHDPILSNWAGLRQGRHPLYEETGLADLASVLEKQNRAGVRLSVIDCAFEDEDTLFHMAGAADLVVVPTHAETGALERASGGAALAEQQRKPFIFVINAAEPDAEAIGDAAMYLAQHGTVSPVIMPCNDDLGTSIRMGQTIVELNRTSPASSEVARLWDYLLSRLDRVPRQATHSFRASLPNLPVAAEPERKALPVRVPAPGASAACPCRSRAARASGATSPPRPAPVPSRGPSRPSDPRSSAQGPRSPATSKAPATSSFTRTTKARSGPAPCGSAARPRSAA